MSYIGQQLPADVFSGFTIDKFTGDGTANKALTLSEAPFNETAVLVTIDGVVQEPTDDFTVSGTTLTLVGTAANGSEINVTHLSGPVQVTQAASLDLNGASDKLILDADADTTISADTDDEINIKVGGTDAFNILGSKLIVNDSASHTDDFLQIETPASGGGHGVQIRRNDSNTDQTVGRVQFGNNADVDLGIISCKTDGATNTGAIVVSTASSGTTAERFRVTEAGIHIGATADANALDDYEEGTWTGTFKSSDGNMTMNSSYQTGRYVKVGRLVHITGYFAASANGAANTSQGLRIHGLPFDVASSNQSYGGGALGYYTGLALSSGGVPAYYVRPGEDGISFTQSGIGTTDISGLTVANLSTDGAIMLSATYYTTS